MLNKELLLAGSKGIEPHVVLTVEYGGEAKVYNMGYSQNWYGSLTRVPWWGNRNTYLSSLFSKHDSSGGYLYTRFNCAEEWVRAPGYIYITRADTKEKFKFVNDDNYTYKQMGATDLFHDLHNGDTVGLIFDPPPDGYE